jgi:hypothetical protein
MLPQYSHTLLEYCLLSDEQQRDLPWWTWSIKMLGLRWNEESCSVWFVFVHKNFGTTGVLGTGATSLLLFYLNYIVATENVV